MAASNILETFFILFKSNTDEVKKGSDDAKRASGDLEESLTRTEAAGVAMGEHLMQTFGALAASLVAAFSVERAVAYTSEVAELNAQLGLTSRRLGIGVADLYAYGQAAEETGGSIGGLLQTLDFLNKGFADIATKGTSRLKPFFDELKIRVTDSPHHVRPLLDILGELADKLSKLDAQGRAGIAEKLGIDEGLVLTLAMGRRGLEDLVKKQKEIGTVTQEDTEIAHKFGRSMEELRDRARLTATAFGSSVLPALTDFFNWVGKIVDYLAGHKGLVEGFFAGLAGVIATIYLPAAIEAAAATWAFLAPILAIVVPILAVAAAIAFVTDDIQNFLAGNKSVIGELSKTWPVVGETVRDALKSAGDIWQWFVDLLEGGVSVVTGTAQLIAAVWGRVTGVFGEFTEGLAKAFPFWAKVFNALGELIGGVGHIILDVVKTILQMAAAIGKFGASAVGAIPSLLKSLGGGAHELALAVAGPTGSLAAAKKQIKLADTTPISAHSSGSIGAGGSKSATNNVNVNAPITVNAAPGMSAEEIAGHVTRHIDHHVRQAVNHSDDGVDR